jgi:hypothetical protein
MPFDPIAQGLGSFANAATNLIGINSQRTSRNRDRRQQYNQFMENLNLARGQNQMAREQFEEQKYLARSGLQVRVADAKKAGINPLAAMGMPTTGGSPVQLGGAPAQAPYAPPSNSADLAVMGQSIGRAIEAVADIFKEKKASEAQAGDIVKEPQRVTVSAKDSSAHAPAAQVGIGTLRMAKNLFLGTKSEKAAEQLEDDILGNITHFFMRSVTPPPKSQLPKGRVDWQFILPGVWYSVSREQKAAIDKWDSRKGKPIYVPIGKPKIRK